MRVLYIDPDPERSAIARQLLAVQDVDLVVEPTPEYARLRLEEEFAVVLAAVPSAPPWLFDVARERRVPILLLNTERCAPQEVADLLRQGADDVVALPFWPSELAERLRVAARRANGHAGGADLRIGDLVIQPALGRISVGDRRAHLPQRPMGVLELLHLRRGQVVTKGRILDVLYGMSDHEPEQKIIDVFVCKIRATIALLTPVPYLHTVWGRGYVLEHPDSLDTKVSDVMLHARRGPGRPRNTIAESRGDAA